MSYRTIPREDSDAIYAYLMNQPAGEAVPTARTACTSPPTSASPCTAGTCCSPKPEVALRLAGHQRSTGKRGRYLVETLGHCGECHTPRGSSGQIDRERPLAGNSKLGRFAAPDITPQGLAARGWNAACTAAVPGHAASARRRSPRTRCCAWSSCRPADSPRRPARDHDLPARRRAAAGDGMATAATVATGPGPTPLPRPLLGLPWP